MLPSSFCHPFHLWCIVLPVHSEYRQSALFKTCTISPWAARCHTSRQWCRGCRCTCRGGRAARGPDSHWSFRPQPPGERKRTSHKRNIRRCQNWVCSCGPHLPRCPKWLVVGHLDLGGDLGRAPASVLQGGCHDVAGLHSLILAINVRTTTF